MYMYIIHPVYRPTMKVISMVDYESSFFLNLLVFVFHSSGFSKCIISKINLNRAGVHILPSNTIPNVD